MGSPNDYVPLLVALLALVLVVLLAVTLAALHGLRGRQRVAVYRAFLRVLRR
ncbi:hypothetical protein [Streptomyces venezuelae]|uniref:hypothetical protein n=1 Tax=Streptomyces venezuelae TaxID=54571 RepID=UPI003625C74A